MLKQIFIVATSISLLIMTKGEVFAQTVAEHGTQAFAEIHKKYIGLYSCDDEFLVVGMFPSAEIIYFERMKTGDMRFLTRGKENAEYWYSPTRNATESKAGTVSFRSIRNDYAQELIWRDDNDNECEAKRFDANIEDVRFLGAEASASLAGTLIYPRDTEESPAVVLTAQSDRYDIWEVGMWLLSRGVAVLTYDRRNAPSGQSTGPEINGRYQDQQAGHAQDVLAAVQYLRTRAEIDPERIGVAGWSGGGYTAAFAAGADPRLAFYLNIAGDASPEFEQASHLFASRLLREGFSDADVEAARKFIRMHFGVAGGDVSWDDYQQEIDAVSDRQWYQYLTQRFSIPYTIKEGVTKIGEYQSQWPPERVYGQIDKTPTLGVFFEYDHSSAPSSPFHFLKSLHDAKNSDYTVVIVPDANHGGFVLNGAGYRFDTNEFTGRSPILIDQIADWTERHLSK